MDVPTSPVRRPMNAFLIFCKRHRSIIRSKNPHMDNRNVTRILGELWAKLPADEKKVYTDLAQQYKEAFMKANPDYKWYNPEKSSTPTKPITRPSNASRHVTATPRKYNKAADHEDAIKLGKLADPTDMGGLNLLLMAGQETAVRKIDFEDNDQSSDKTVNWIQIPSATSTEVMASIVTNRIAMEHAQQAQENLGNPGQEVVDHVIDQLYFAERCRVHSFGDSSALSTSREPQCTTNVEPQKEILSNLEVSTSNDLAPRSLKFSPKKEFQYRWRSMSASGELESFQRFQGNRLNLQNEASANMETAEIDERSQAKTESSEEIESEQPWKSPRANRGQRYKEMMSEGLLHKHSQKKSTSDSDEDHSGSNGQTKDQFLKPQGMTRKRTMSESDARLKTICADKRYKTGGFDLDAEIASITPCALDSVSKKKFNRLHSRARHHSEGSKRHTVLSLSTDKMHILTVGELHREKALRTPSPPTANCAVTGSQRRKARKSSITHMILVESLEKIPGVMPETDVNKLSNGNNTSITLGANKQEENKKDNENSEISSSVNSLPVVYSLPSLTDITSAKLKDLGLTNQATTPLCSV